MPRRGGSPSLVHGLLGPRPRPGRLPDDAAVLDGGTLGLELVHRLFRTPLSVHQVGVDELLGTLALLGRMPPETHVVGVEPGDTQPALGLSPAVEAAVPRLLATVERLAMPPSP